MTTDMSYEAILNATFDTLPKPQLTPDGSWLLRGRNAVFVPGKDGNSPKVLFFYNPKEPMSDVDQGALDAMGDYDVSQNDVVAQFWAQRPKDWEAIDRHFQLHGIDTKGKTIQSLLKDFAGSEIIGVVGTRTYTNNAGQNVTDNTVSAWAAVE